MRVVVVGNGGHARACLDAWGPSSELEPVGYLAPEPGDVLGLPYLGTDADLLEMRNRGITAAFVALGSNRLRSELVGRVIAAELDLVTVVAPTATVGATAAVGAGTVVMHRAVLGAKARVGSGSIINTGATIDHDCVIGDFVHVAPGVNLAGTVTVGDRAMVGIGASVVPGVTIGADAVIGAGAVVLHDVPAGRTVVGVPAEERRT